MQSPLIAWSKIFEIGHKGLDAEHRRLIEIINAIHIAAREKSSPGQLEALLRDLEFMSVAHFKHENSVMRLEMPPELVFATMNEHLAEHAQMLSQLREIVRDFREAPDSGKEPCKKLKNWFLEHTGKYDGHLKTAFQAMPARAAY